MARIGNAGGGRSSRSGSGSLTTGNLSDPTGYVSSNRSRNVPTGPGAAYTATTAAFASNSQQSGSGDDWRVKLSIPPNFFESSPILRPLVEAGGMIFPYTPSISINHTADYDSVNITHQNYMYMAYQQSRQDQIQLTAPFYVEDYVQAQYWIAAVHYFRSITKMYTADTEYAGSPPPIVYLSGYGDYVFKNVPVVVRQFQVELTNETDYISTAVDPPPYTPGSYVGPSVNSADMESAGGNYPSIEGKTHVPVKSTFTVGLMPIYSRESVRQFSLQKFVNGDYMDGYI